MTIKIKMAEATSARGIATYYGRSDLLAPGQVGWLLAFTVLSVFMFGSMFCAVGGGRSMHQEALL